MWPSKRRDSIHRHPSELYLVIVRKMSEYRIRTTDYTNFLNIFIARKGFIYACAEFAGAHFGICLAGRVACIHASHIGVQYTLSKTVFKYCCLYYYEFTRLIWMSIFRHKFIIEFGHLKRGQKKIVIFTNCITDSIQTYR